MSGVLVGPGGGGGGPGEYTVASGGNGPDVPRRRRIALEKLHHANDKQNGRPRSVELDMRNAVEEKQNAEGNKHRGPHQPAGAALLASASTGDAAQQSPVFRKKPDTKQDECQRYENTHANLKQPCRVQEEKNTQADQDGCTGGNFRSLKSSRRRQTSRLNRTGLGQALPSGWLWRCEPHR